MKTLLFSLLAACAVGWVQLVAKAEPGAAAFTVLDAPREGPRITEYLRYQLDRAWQQDESRAAVYAAVRSADDLAALRRQVRERLLAAIGGLPGERTPLNARVVGTIGRPGYRIERLIFESLPGIHVTALVYLPDGPADRRPAVLLACGHSPDGKAFGNYQEIAGRLASRGYVVLCWDPVGQGERSQFWDAARRRSRYNLVCGEHAVLGNLATLAGANLARWSVWDGMRALDYLLTRPEVDPARISITGTSGGGFQAATIGALDERIRVVVPSCFLTSLPMRMANRIFDDPDSDPEQDPFGSVSGGIDHPGLLLLVQPRPVVVVAAARDFVPIEGARKTFREAAALYDRFGARDRIALVEGLHEPLLDRFNGMPVRRGFEPVATLPVDRLTCTPSGQVRVDLPGRSLTDEIRDYYTLRRGHAGTTGLAERYRGGSYPGVDRWPFERGAIPTRRDLVGWESKGTTRVGDVAIDRYLLRHSGGLLMPLLHLHPVGSTGRPILLDVALDGKARPEDWTRLQARLSGGYDVVSFDLRGVGETRMRYRAVSGDDPGIAPADEAAAYFSPLSGVLANHVYNSLLLGRPYFLEALEDVEIAARFSRTVLGAQRVVAAGRGDGQTLAWAASRALPAVEWLPDPGVAMFRWSDAVESSSESWPIQYLVPGGAYLDQPPGR